MSPIKEMKKIRKKENRDFIADSFFPWGVSLSMFALAAVKQEFT